MNKINKEILDVSTTNWTWIDVLDNYKFVNNPFCGISHRAFLKYSFF